MKIFRKNSWKIQKIIILISKKLSTIFHEFFEIFLIFSQVPGRAGIDCKIRWLNVDSPTINKNEWTKDEDKILLSLAKDHHAHDWDSISRELGVTPVTIIEILIFFGI